MAMDFSNGTAYNDLHTMPSLKDIAAQTINFECYYDDNNRFIGMATVDLPTFEYTNTDISGAGIQGVVNVPTLGQTSSMQVTLHWNNITREAFQLLQQKAHTIAMYGAAQYLSTDTHNPEVAQVKIKFTGLAKKVELGKFEQSSTTDTTSEFEITALEVKVNGETMLEVDKFNYVFKVGEVDWFEAIRKALNL